MADLDKNAVPDLIATDPANVVTASPTAGAPPQPPPGSRPDMTLYLKIDLAIPIGTGQAAAAPMTAVFSPDKTQLGSQVDVLLWFHGHKGQLRNINLKGYTAQQYLDVPEFKLRDFILSTSKRKLLLVVPTLGDTSGSGLLGTQAQAEAFLQQVLNGVRKYMAPQVTDIGNIVLAAHSGGGKIMGTVAGFGGTFNKVREIWCFDCTYWSVTAFMDWHAQPSHTLDRLWVFSTGSWDAGLKDPTKPPGPDNPQTRSGTGDNARPILNLAKASKSPSIEVLIKPMPPQSNKTDNFTYGVASGHNESVGFYFPQLVSSSRILS